MSDKLEMPIDQFAEAVAKENAQLNEHNEKLKEQTKLYFHAFNKAASHIEKLEAVTRDDAKWLAAYHQWCKMNGCAPSSSDLIAASEALNDRSVYKEGYRAVEEAMGHPSPEFWVERKYDRRD